MNILDEIRESITRSLSNPIKKEFQLIFVCMGWIVSFIACVGSFQMRKSYANQISRDQKRVLDIYSIGLAVLSGVDVIVIVKIFFDKKENVSDLTLRLLTGVFLMKIILCSIVLYDRYYNLFFSLGIYIPSTRESHQKLFRYVIISPALILVYSIVFFLIFGSQLFD